jgi:hypothetical protein
MDLLRFAEIESHAIILIKLIMDLLRFAKKNLGFESKSSVNSDAADKHRRPFLT